MYCTLRNASITIKGDNTSNPFSTTCMASNVAFVAFTTCLEDERRYSI
jgi:hypothetical protein